MEGDKVRLSPDVGEVHQLDAELRSRVLWEGRVEPDHFHAASRSDIREGEEEGEGEGVVSSGKAWTKNKKSAINEGKVLGVIV